MRPRTSEATHEVPSVAEVQPLGTATEPEFTYGTMAASTSQSAIRRVVRGNPVQLANFHF